MVVADSSAEHLILPVGVATLVIAIVNAIIRNVVAEVTGRSDIEFLRDVVDSQIAIIADISTLRLATTLSSDNDYTVGSLRTVDSGSSSITEHVD